MPLLQERLPPRIYSIQDLRVLLFYLNALDLILLEYRQLIIDDIALGHFPLAVYSFTRHDLFCAYFVLELLLLTQSVLFYFLHLGYEVGFLLRIPYPQPRLLLFFRKLDDPCLDRTLLMVHQLELILGLHHVAVGVLAHARHHHAAVDFEVLLARGEEVFLATDHGLRVPTREVKTVVSAAHPRRFVHFALTVFSLHY